jgi:Toprim domain-containing protein
MTALRSAADILRDFRVSTPSSALGRYYAVCPQCSHKRKKANQKLKCLGVTIDEKGVKLGCNHCAWTDGAFYQTAESTSRAAPVMSEREKADKEKAEEQRRRDLAASRSKSQWLWASRKPLKGSIAEIYLRDCRGYRGPLPATLGFLPARDHHPPAMIAAFGMARETEPGVLVIRNDDVTGVHVTRLKADGSDKVDIEGESAKLTIGLDNRAPIWLAPIDDGLGLAIAEGIEDALSVHAATGLGAWAAGTAGRLPAMADVVPAYVESVTVMVDRDHNGEQNSAELARRLVARGIEVVMVRPGGDGTT